VQKLVLIIESPSSFPPFLPPPSQFGFEESKRRKKIKELYIITSVLTENIFSLKYISLLTSQVGYVSLERRHI